MKGKNDKHFTPKAVDEQIEGLAEPGPQGEDKDIQSAHLTQHLQHHYQAQKRETALQRAWQQIDQRYKASLLPEATTQNTQENIQVQESAGQFHMQEITIGTTSPRRSVSQWERLSVVAVLFLLVGGTILMTSLTPQLKGDSASGGGKPADPNSTLQTHCTPVPPPIGWEYVHNSPCTVVCDPTQTPALPTPTPTDLTPTP